MTLEKAKFLLTGIKVTGQEKEAIEKIVKLIDSIDDVQGKICDKYCMMPDVYIEKFPDDADFANERMCIEVCENCPLSKMGD